MTDFRIDTRVNTVGDSLHRLLDIPIKTPQTLWDNSQQSLLIEAILARVPLPSIYIDEHAGNVLVGVNTINTLLAFIEAKTLVLTGLKYFCHLEGKSYTDLERPLQRRLMETEVTIHYLTYNAASPEVLRHIQELFTL